MLRRDPGEVQECSAGRGHLVRCLENRLRTELILGSANRNEERGAGHGDKVGHLDASDVLPPDKRTWKNPTDSSRSGRRPNELELWNSVKRDNSAALSRVIKHGTRTKAELDGNPGKDIRSIGDVISGSIPISVSLAEVHPTDRDPENFWRTTEELHPAIPDAPTPPGIEDYSRVSRRLSTTTTTTWSLENEELDLRLRNWHQLRMSGFYYGRMTMEEASHVLERCTPGAFLLRDSSNRRQYLFSLSVQTDRGPTSIRILWDGIQYIMDSDPDQSHRMPGFDCVLRLVEFYRRVCIGASNSKQRRAGRRVYLESSDDRNVRILLRNPVRIKPDSLGHVTRKLINSCLRGRSVDRLPLPPSLRTYLAEYPYDV